jgi:hypothetical protein
MLPGGNYTCKNLKSRNLRILRNELYAPVRVESNGEYCRQTLMAAKDPADLTQNLQNNVRLFLLFILS